MIRLIIAGSRNFQNYRILEAYTDVFLAMIKPAYQVNEVEIISGAARGADTLGEAYAKRKGFTLKRFPADFEKYGNAAGPLRNEQMSNYATHCIIFWDGGSPGSNDMLQKANKRNLHTLLYNDATGVKTEYNVPEE